MSIEAFGSRRVSESLRAIAKYIDEGAKIARGGSPRSSRQTRLRGSDTNDAESTAHWRALGGLGDREKVLSIPSAELDLSDDVDVNVVVSGINQPEVGLTNRITLFKLVGARRRLRCTFKRRLTSFLNNRPTSFEAALHLITWTRASFPPLGFYHVFAVNLAGQTFLLANACSIVQSVRPSLLQGSARAS